MSSLTIHYARYYNVKRSDEIIYGPFTGVSSSDEIECRSGNYSSFKANTCFGVECNDNSRRRRNRRRLPTLDLGDCTAKIHTSFSQSILNEEYVNCGDLITTAWTS